MRAASYLEIKWLSQAAGGTMGLHGACGEIVKSSWSMRRSGFLIGSGGGDAGGLSGDELTQSISSKAHY